MRIFRKALLSMAIVTALSALITVDKAYAGNINPDEQQLINYCNGVVYTYEGKTYMCSAGAIGALTSELMSDTRDLNAAQVQSAINIMGRNVAQGITEGYLIEVNSGDIDEPNDEGNNGNTGENAGGEGNNGNTGENTGGEGNNGNTGENAGGEGNNGNTGENAGGEENNGNTGENAGGEGNNGNTGGNASDEGNNGNIGSGNENSGESSSGTGIQVIIPNGSGNEQTEELEDEQEDVKIDKIDVITMYDESFPIKNTGYSLSNVILVLLIMLTSIVSVYVGGLVFNRKCMGGRCEKK